MAAGIAARAISLASLPLIARFYAPADLGLWVMILSLTTYFTSLATLRYDIAVVIAPTLKAARALVLAIGSAVAAASALLAMAVALLPPSAWCLVSGLPADRQGLIGVMPGVLLLLCAHIVLQAYATRRRRFLALGLSQITQAIVTPAATLGALFMAPASATTAAFGAVLGLAGGNAALLLDVGPELWPSRNKGWPRIALAIARRFKVYPYYMLPYTLSAGLSERFLQIVFATSYSIAAFGAFSIARQLMLAPSMFLSSTMRQVMFAHSAERWGPEARRDRVLRVLSVLIDGVCPAIAFGLFWLVPLTQVLMPSGWADVAQYAWLILLPACTRLLSDWLDRMVDVLGRQRLGVAVRTTSDTVFTVAALASPWLKLDVFGMVALLSAVTATSNLIFLGLVLRLMGVQAQCMLKLATRAIVMMLATGICQWCLSLLFPPASGLIFAMALLLVTLTRAVVQLTPRTAGV
jgi:O-antigen/teichoic acid export membrane protein